MTSITSLPRTMDARRYLQDVERDGFAIVAGVLDVAQTASLIEAVETAPASAFAREPAAAHGRRDLLDVPEISQLAASEPIRELVDPLLGAGAFAVRGLWFDKLPNANWKVAWHQDLTIAVCERRDVPGFGAWSVKDGVDHVQPPVEILQRMIAVRIHLDDCGDCDGPLRVLAGSHRFGRLSAEAAARWRQAGGETICRVRRGGALVMRPLLLHASSAALHPSHRRVIHLEFAADELPSGLKWRNR